MGAGVGAGVGGGVGVGAGVGVGPGFELGEEGPTHVNVETPSATVIGIVPPLAHVLPDQPAPCLTSGPGENVKSSSKFFEEVSQLTQCSFL